MSDQKKATDLLAAWHDMMAEPLSLDELMPSAYPLAAAAKLSDQMASSNLDVVRWWAPHVAALEARLADLEAKLNAPST